MKSILVTGGNGYIGSHMVNLLKNKNYDVTIIDNLSNSKKQEFTGVEFFVGDIGNKALVTRIFKKKKIEAVMHFAGSIEVSESLKNPGKFYWNNVANTINLLNCMIENNISYFIFSSTAAVYGIPESVPITENHEKNPVNPYGMSKLMVEQLLKDFEKAFDFKYISLRYFNAAGAHLKATYGEQHSPETHLIPNIFETVVGKNQYVSVNGHDYSSSDGTCIRDFVHVHDICEGHFLALEHLLKHGKSNAYNLGSGTGYTVKQVIDKVSQLLKKEIPIKLNPRRLGDPEALIADTSKALNDLKWRAKFSDLHTIVASAWNFYIKHKT